MDYTTQIEQLEELLPLIQATRSSLPSLISSVSTPSPPPHQLDLSTLYRLASTQCESTIKSLTDQLQSVETTLNQAEQSYQRDPKGVVVVTDVDSSKDKSNWERIGDVLAESGGGTTSKNEGKLFQPQLEAPKSKNDLVQFLKTWETKHPKVGIQLKGATTAEVNDVEKLELKLKGIMRVTIVARWEDENRLIVEFVNCFSLKENNPYYRPSRFSLFQELTNSVMSLIDKSLSRPGERISNLEEVLTFLSYPPLPF